MVTQLNIIYIKNFLHGKGGFEKPEVSPILYQLDSH